MCNMFFSLKWPLGQFSLLRCQSVCLSVYLFICLSVSPLGGGNKMPITQLKTTGTVDIIINISIKKKHTLAPWDWNTHYTHTHNIWMRMRMRMRTTRATQIATTMTTTKTTTTAMTGRRRKLYNIQKILGKQLDLFGTGSTTRILLEVEWGPVRGILTLCQSFRMSGAWEYCYQNILLPPPPLSQRICTCISTLI